MKINLAENMLRFGAKNLTSSNVKKLEQLYEQENIEDDASALTVPMTDIKLIINDTSTKSSGKIRTMWANFTPEGTPPSRMAGSLSFNSPALANDKLNKTAVSINHDGFLLNNKSFAAGVMESIDLIYYATNQLFGSSPIQSNVEETIRALMYVRDRLKNEPSPAARMISENITKILRVCFTIAEKDYEEFLSLDRKHGGYIDNRAAQMIYNSCRIIKGLSLDAVKVMADPAYREQRAKQRQTTKPG